MNLGLAPHIFVVVVVCLRRRHRLLLYCGFPGADLLSRPRNKRHLSRLFLSMRGSPGTKRTEYSFFLREKSRGIGQNIFIVNDIAIVLDKTLHSLVMTGSISLGTAK